MIRSKDLYMDMQEAEHIEHYRQQKEEHLDNLLYLNNYNNGTANKDIPKQVQDSRSKGRKKA